MTFQSLVNNLTNDTLQISLPLFRPELIICATIVVMLLVRVFSFGYKLDPFWLALVGTFLALLLALPAGGFQCDRAIGEAHRQEIFTGMLVYDSMTVFFRMFLLAFAFWFIILVRITGLADKQDGQDFYTLLFGSTLGMCLMASANHLMTVFLSVEMASVPSYVLAGIIKGRRRSSEAALKYAVYGAGAAGVMLYGISLLAGLTGSAHLPTIAAKLAAMDIPGLVARGEGGGTLMVLVLAGLMIAVGLAFKLSAVPFHFWCPDVFEGAAAEVDAFLSVASKARRDGTVGSRRHWPRHVRARTAGAQPATALALAVPAHTVAFQQPPRRSARRQRCSAAGSPAKLPTQLALHPVRKFIVLLLAIMAAVTCTFGNLVAYGQTNIKRMLAYSTIAHAGYMIMAVAAAVQLAGSNPAGAREAVAALLFYLVAYVFMNLGAFAIVAFLRNAIGTEEIADYAGLIRSAPVTSVAFTAILVSLIGIPPMVGFIGKFAIFQFAGHRRRPVDDRPAGNRRHQHGHLTDLLLARGESHLHRSPSQRIAAPLSIGLVPAVYVLVVAVPVIIYGILPSRIFEVARAASEQLFM